MTDYLKYALAFAILLVVQKALVWLIALTEYQITPDLVLIGVVYLGIRKGKIPGSIGGFLTGLIFDLLSFSFIGLSALSKATSGFVSGFFNNENKIDRYSQTYVFTLIVFLSSLFNNFLYFSLYFQGTSLSMLLIIIRYVIPTAVYTAILSIILPLVARRRFAKRL